MFCQNAKFGGMEKFSAFKNCLENSTNCTSGENVTEEMERKCSMRVTP